mmetsp:Transcript_23164/g.51928  ORF Transcript_23164/g.51928 Transcript_23164/m.51928 type:complete len:292 (+) Transcript_23164:91-966(+)
MRSKLIICTACDNNADAEVLHPLLQVPICGACSSAYKEWRVVGSAVVTEAEAVVEADVEAEGEAKAKKKNDSFCTWCGLGDDNTLCMCDGCVRSFCSDCIRRNFGRAEAGRVIGKEGWRCYCCSPTEALKALQMNVDVSFFNIDRAYAEVRPPSLEQVRSAQEAMVGALTPAEQAFVNLFRDIVFLHRLGGEGLIGSYLTALDLAAVWRVSKGVRRLSSRHKFIVPGLFSTPHWEEHKALRPPRLLDHQVVALDEMARMENASADFGAMRGGIFADEPGMGKTVTSLVGVT